MNTRQAAWYTPVDTAANGRWVVRLGEWSWQISLRNLLANAACLALGLVLMLTALIAGEIRLGPAELLSVVQGDGPAALRFLVREIRLPRLLAALTIGAALGLAGVLLQTLARNRLASPDVLGISDGATLALGVTLLWSSNGLLGPWWHALLGALLTVALVLLAAGGVGSQGYRVLVVGLGFGSLLKAGLELVLATLPLQHSGSVYLFSIGSLVGLGYQAVLPAGILLAALLCLVVPLARRLGLLQLPDDIVRGLGVPLRRTQFAVTLLAAALAGLAVSIAGPIGFVAIAAPIIARRLCGPGVVPLSASALIGVLLTLGADQLGRLLAPPVEIPAGVITGTLGGPFLLWVLFARTGRGA